MFFNICLRLYVYFILFAISASKNMDLLQFPEGFRFGTATSSFQIEGAWNEGGKGESMWDHATHTKPEIIADRSNADIACDSYHLYKQDVQLIKDIGFSYYRFSISWPRILPNGKKDKINQEGIQYYHNLIDELLKNGIEPMVTIYHWDLPQKLQEEGGWQNRTIVQYFEDYARILFSNFGDKVKVWFTLNEPVYVSYGYGGTMLVPLLNEHGTAEYEVVHHLLLAHARAYRVYEKEFKAKQNGQVSIALESPGFLPATNSTEDKEASETAMIFHLGWLADPIYSKKGDYPAIMRQKVDENSKKEGLSKSRLPTFTQEEIDMIRGSSDFFAYQHYTSQDVAFGEDGQNPSVIRDSGVRRWYNKNWQPSTLSWLKLVPEGLRFSLNWIKNRYGNPLVYITEHGYGEDKQADSLDDQKRIDWIKAYLKSLLKAIKEDHCNVKGYTLWSLMDNFEWLHGYAAKFGIYKVDFNDPKRKRTPKKSAHYIKRLIATRNIDV